ncbi:MAG: hypothetical protein ACQKBU_12145 [Verrucomicrobiales bacterium]
MATGMAKAYGIRVAGFCGVADRKAWESAVFDGLHALADSGLPTGVLIERAAELLTELVATSDLLNG